MSGNSNGDNDDNEINSINGDENNTTNNTNYGNGVDDGSNNTNNTNNTTNNTSDDAQETNSNRSNSPITTFDLDETIDNTFTTITNQQGTTVEGSNKTKTTFTTKDLSNNVVIDEDLEQDIEVYDESESSLIVDEIKLYAEKIKCTEFQGKGTIDDYSQLFLAASKIANETKQIELDVDVDGFNDFASAADELSALFNGFIVKLQNVNIINDSRFLASILNALKRIDNLSNVFGKFKETIMATSTIKIPKSAHDTAVQIQNVMGELNCAMKYISHFVAPTEIVPNNAQLDNEDITIIDQAIDTIEHWNLLSEQGVSIALNNNTDIQYIKQANTELKTKSNVLKGAVISLKEKFAFYNITR
jgi:hypothetical protein